MKMSNQEAAITHPKVWYWGVLDKQLSSKQAWMTLAVMFVFGLMSMFGFIRVAPVLPILQSEFGFELANVGLIQTLYTFAGVLLMFPGTWIMRNVGVKLTLVVACAFSILGSAIGIFSHDQITLLLSRLLEGIGSGFIMFLGANVCTRIFPQKKLGIAMAVWSVWAPAGAFLALFGAPYLHEMFGWRSLWLVTMIVYAICLVWMLFSFKLPKVNENELTVMRAQKDPAASGAKTKTARTLVVSTFVMSLSFLVWGLVFGGCTNSFYPTFLMEVKGFSIYDAGFWPSMISLLTLPLGIGAGLLSDKLGTRKWFVTISYLLMAVIMGFVAWREVPGMGTVIVFVIAMSVFSAAIPMGTRASIPEYTPDPKTSDYALTTMVFVGNLGQALGVLFGTTVAAVGWANGGLFFLMPCCLVAGLATLFFCKNDFKGKRNKVQESV
jgi:MFS family permease